MMSMRHTQALTSALHVVWVAKERQAAEPAFCRFLDLGAARGHQVQWLAKRAFLAADLAGVDIVCLKNHIDDNPVWHRIEAHRVRAVNRREACMSCSDRSRLDAMLRAGGVRMPLSASTADEVLQLRLPIVQKPKLASAPRDVRIFSRPPVPIDCERYFYQELIGGQGPVYKVYCIGDDAFLVEESGTGAPACGAAPGQRQAMAMDPRLTGTARTVGRLTGLEVYGLDFVGSPGDLLLIDVNPFPSFRCLPQAADALWDHLEHIGPATGSEPKEPQP